MDHAIIEQPNTKFLWNPAFINHNSKLKCTLGTLYEKQAMSSDITPVGIAARLG